MKQNAPRTKLLIAIVISFLFIYFHQSPHVIVHDNAYQENVDSSSIIKQYNDDASLSNPFLDKINKRWYVDGGTKIRNTGSIKLTDPNSINEYGVILSNGIGDNIINDFEIIFNFKVSDFKNNNEGLAFVISSENGFIWKDLHGSFATKQYEIQSGGVLASDHSLMGFPRNLPGLAIIIDTLVSDSNSRMLVPFMDLYLNSDPKTQYYDLGTDGIRSTSKRLNEDHIKLDEQIINGEFIKLRIIYMESISFLKIDARHNGAWRELFRSNDNLYLPKNKGTDQRYIGMGALSGRGTAELFSIETNEFHWQNHDESMEETYAYAKELEKFFLNEYEQYISIEKDNFDEWRIIKSQHHSQRDKISGHHIYFKFFWRWFFGVVILLLLYLISLYIRVTKRHLRRLNRKKEKLVIYYQHEFFS
ncbi:hypothetical protein KAFR_0A03320 [Kazachstania africana CBS 2517]|uniref:L-type lectin-like domain-containing protein n=1 Tax=Kazachstania africana (strain ATCC 22294 / BCRC 22015 / CBS 2517 / CECT 1963 / NBRC 1671 / NRRL Y-8276) TaxID=1071382 RepID=H2AN17_KAZAF|nr:hypothetical protein KAFR_0A03320 [Kazachstania africana CBS 2517]CCF55767.1 hypothetical protein KAFR_0A03320 [Kazachstania africana CBS 2517]